MRSAAWVVLVLVVGCDDVRTVMPDAPIDSAPLIDVPTGTPDFFGEACDPPSTLGVEVQCRLELPYPKAYCTPLGICRPFCESVSLAGGGFGKCTSVGGVERFAFETSAARVCYCDPP